MQATEDASFITGQNATNICQQQILSALTASRGYQLQICTNGTSKFDVSNQREQNPQGFQEMKII